MVMGSKELMNAPIRAMLNNGSSMLVSRIKEIVFSKLLEQEVKYAETTTAAQMQVRRREEGERREGGGTSYLLCRGCAVVLFCRVCCSA